MEFGWDLGSCVWLGMGLGCREFQTARHVVQDEPHTARRALTNILQLYIEKVCVVHCVDKACYGNISNSAKRCEKQPSPRNAALRVSYTVMRKHVCHEGVY